MSRPLVLHTETFRDHPDAPAALAGGAAYDTAVSHALLRAVAAGEHPECLRLYRPADALAFSALDRTRDGFAKAARAASDSGFDPMVRLTGGRAAAFERDGLAFAWTIPIDDPRAGLHARFRDAAQWVVRAFQALGIDAEMGCVPGEYCPGDYSVNAPRAAGAAAGSRVKLMGVGQRIVRGAAHLGGVVVVRGSARVGDALAEVYRHLDYPLDASTIGAVEDARPGTEADEVERALLEALAPREARAEPLPAAVVEHARSLTARHAVEGIGVDARVHGKALAEGAV